MQQVRRIATGGRARHDLNSVAERLNVTRRTVERLIKQYDDGDPAGIRPTRDGGRVFVLESDLRDHEERCRRLA